MNFNPLEAAKAIKKDFIEYILTRFNTSIPQIQGLDPKKELEEDLNSFVSKGPFIEIKCPFVKTYTIEQLSNGEPDFNSEILSPRMKEIIPDKSKSLRLYTHQKESIKLVDEGRNVVVTTGTGSGKTEAFMYPLVNELLKEEDKNSRTLGPGIRALIIYPMNALIDDQIERLNSLLKGTDITFGLLNGRTQWKKDQALIDYQNTYKSNPLTNHLLSRDEMIATPPNIMLTNYSMLENCLISPNFKGLIDNPNNNLRFIILDETHIYKGATGMECSQLFNRLRARIKTKEGFKAQFIFASATLGNKKQDEGIKHFASILSSQPEDSWDIIHGTVQEPYLSICNTQLGENKIARLYDLVVLGKDGCKDSAFPGLNEANKEEYLFDLISQALEFKKIYELSRNGAIDIDTLSKELGFDPGVVEKLLALLKICKKDNTALVDIKNHYFMRALNGAYLIADPNYSGKRIYLSDGRKDDNEPLKFEMARCSVCRRIAIVGRLDNSKSKLDSYLTMAGKNYPNPIFMSFAKESDFKGDEDPIYDEDSKDALSQFVVSEDNKTGSKINQVNKVFDSPDESDEDNDIQVKNEELKGNTGNHLNKIYLCLHCGYVDEEDVGSICPRCGSAAMRLMAIVTSNKKFQLGSQGNNYVSYCPYCGQGSFRRFYFGENSAASILAISLLKNLPSEVNEDGREKGKQFLIFSDSLARSSFFTLYFSKFIKEYSLNRLMYTVQKEFNEPVPIGTFIRDLGDYRNSIVGLEDNEKDDFAQDAALYAINQLIGQQRASSLVHNHILSFKYNYKDSSREAMKEISSHYGVDSGTVERLAQFYALWMASKGLVNLGSSEDGKRNPWHAFSNSDLEFLTYYKQPQSLVVNPQECKKYGTITWLPAQGHQNTILKVTEKALGLDENKAREFMLDFFTNVLQGENVNPLVEKIELPCIRYFVVPGNQTQWYLCQECHRTWSVNPNGMCLTAKCGGALKPASHEDIEAMDSHDLFKEYFTTLDLEKFTIKDHNSQISKKDQMKTQQEFKEGKLNIISSTTTFELGIDLGNLQTVFMRNMPPSPANYIQRAGRSGRSQYSANFSLTYCKLGSHDMTFFKNPKDMIDGRIASPKFKTDNTKVVFRHIWDTIFDYFFGIESNKAYFDKLNLFINGCYDKFASLVLNPTEGLCELLRSSFTSENIKEFNIDEYEPTKDNSHIPWVESLIGDNGKLSGAVEERKETFDKLSKLLSESSDLKGDQIYALQKQINNLNKQRVVDFLTLSGILPEYGFPVDVVRLSINDPYLNTYDLNDGSNLSRPLNRAIAEFAPGESVICNKKEYKSRYINLSNPKQLSINRSNFVVMWTAKCKNCNGMIVHDYSPQDLTLCPYCQEPIDSTSFKEVIDPINGFTASKTVIDMPSLIRPLPIYQTRIKYVGDLKKYEPQQLNIIKGSDIEHIHIYMTKNDKFYIQNNREVFVCPKCGYGIGPGDSQFKKLYKDSGLEHKDSEGYECSNKILKPYSLAHEINTDALYISIPDKLINSAMKSFEKSDALLSTSYALVRAMCESLDIERQDLSCATVDASNISIDSPLNGPTSEKGCGIILYDTMDGGIGNAHRLMDKVDGKLQIERIVNKAKENMESCQCDKACYGCLEDYYNQFYHDKLNRHLAFKLLDVLSGEYEFKES